MPSRFVEYFFQGERREVVLGDLEEGFANVLSRTESRGAAARWYWRNALSSLLALSVEQLRRRFPHPHDGVDPLVPAATPSRARGDSIVSHWLQDLHHAARALMRTPSFTAVVLLTLTIGVGATTAIFSVVHGVLILPPPYPGSERMVYSPRRQEDTGVIQWYWSHLNYRDVREQATSFDLLEGVRLGSVVVTGRDRAERFFIRYVTPRFLDMYAARPFMGRMLGAEDDRVPGGHPVVLITYKIWQSYFGGDSGVVGTSVNLSGIPYTVVGVLNPEFSYPFGQDVGSEVDLWVPAMMAGEAHPRGTALFADRGARAFSIIGRLKEGVSLDQAQAEVDGIAAQLAREHPESNRGYGVYLRNWAKSKTVRVRGPLLVLMSAAAVLLLIGCFNVANLMLVRGATRQRELAIRLALGAGRRTLVRYLIAEAAVLAVIGGGLGVLAAYAGLPVLVSIVAGSLRVTATQIPPEAQVSINGAVLFAALGISLIAGVLFGIFPAWRASSADLRIALSGSERHGTDRGGTRIRSGLVMVEIATATTLLAASALLIRGVNEMRRIDLGFLTERVLTMRMGLPASKYRDDDALVRVTAAVRERIGAQPGVVWATSWGLGLPGVSAAPRSVAPDGMVIDAVRDAPQGRAHYVGSGALREIGIPLVRGREFVESDRIGTLRVAVVSETFARKLWLQDDAIGRTFREFAQSGDRLETAVWTVVGIAADARMEGPLPVLGAIETADDVYFPAAQRPLQEVYFVVHTEREPDFATVREAVRAVDPDIPLYEIATLNEHMTRQEGPTRFTTLLMSAFAIAALLLAALGVYGVLAFAVAQRTREIGLRTALGAGTGATLWLFLRQGARLALGGVVIGCAGALGLGRVLASLIVGISGMDVFPLIGAAALLSAVALAACFVPAHRATRIAPAEALRE